MKIPRHIQVTGAKTFRPRQDPHTGATSLEPMVRLTAYEFNGEGYTVLGRRIVRGVPETEQLHETLARPGVSEWLLSFEPDEVVPCRVHHRKTLLQPY